MKQIVLLSLVLVLAASLQAQANVVLQELPKAVNLGGPKPEPNTNGGEIYRPIGWSADGKFAYIQEHFIDGRGGTQFNYCILNTITDKLVASIADDTENWPSRVLEDDAAESWRRNAEAFRKLLASNKIQVGRGIELQQFPLVNKIDTFTAKLELVKNPNHDADADFGPYQGYTITVSAKTNGQKTVTKVQKQAMMAAWIGGYFASPFDDRIVVVNGEIRFVFEGTEAFYRFSGCILNSGFKK